MSRKLTAALALTVAGGVYFVAGSAQASNMGFKLERSFEVVREVPTDPSTPFQNIYLHSFPLFNGLGDIGSSSAGGDKCAAGPDGTVDSVDAVCDLFINRVPVTDRGNSFAISRFNRDTCAFEVTPAGVGAFGLNVGAAFTLERDAAIWITVASTKPDAPLNRSVTVGSHDPSYTGRQIRVPASGCLPRVDLINVPYHTMYQFANEILCGLEGLDWVDVVTNSTGSAPPDGNPDTCTGGIFDGTHLIAVSVFDNINDDSTVPTLDNAFTPRSVSFSLGQLRFAGQNFPLTPGDGYQVNIPPGQVTTTFLSPHF